MSAFCIEHSNNNNNKIERVSDLERIGREYSLLLVHQITSSDLELQCKQKIPFAIAWFGEPFNLNNSVQHKYIRTLQTSPKLSIVIESLSEQIQRYPDLNKKISQLQSIQSITNSDLSDIPQWIQCNKCRKWRIRRIQKQCFPDYNDASHWKCDMNHAPMNHCNVPQIQPTDQEFSALELTALQIQRELKQERVRYRNQHIVGDWIKVAHNLLDQMIRRFDEFLQPFIHPIGYETYYKSINNAMCISKLKYQLENNKITTFTHFIFELTKIWDHAIKYYHPQHPLHQRAIILRQYSFDLIKQLKNMPDRLKQQIKQLNIMEMGQQRIQKTKPIIPPQHNILAITQSDEPMITSQDVEQKQEDEQEQDVNMNIDTNSNENIANNDNNNDDSNDIDNNNDDNIDDNNDDNNDIEPLIHITAEEHVVIQQPLPALERGASSQQTVNNHSTDVSLPRLKLSQIPNKPKIIQVVDELDNVQALPSLTAKIQVIIGQIEEFDEEGHFFKEVQLNGYDKIIKNPIHFGQILDGIKEEEYDTMGDILRDVELIWSNCYTFNGKPEPNNPERGFSNFAHDLDLAFNEYIKQFTQILKIRGYIKEDDINEMNRIRKKLDLGRTSTNRLYHFQTRLEIYQHIENLFDKYDGESFRTYIKTTKSNYCRDLKNGMNVQGPVIPTSLLMENISKRFKLIKETLSTESTESPEQSIESTQVSIENNNMDDNSSNSSSEPTLSRLSMGSTHKKQNIIRDSDTDSDEETISDEISTMRSEIQSISTTYHKYAMNGPYFQGRYKRKWCCDNKECKHTEPGVYRTYDIPYWISSKQGREYSLCDGCVRPQHYTINNKKIRFFRDKDGSKVRLGLDCPYPRCHSALQVLQGAIHANCHGNRCMIRCNHCKCIISFKSMLLYYHCIDGCLDHGSTLSHQYYLCEQCATTYYDSPQKYISSTCKSLAFHGVWTSFDDNNNNECEIMIMLQDSNRVSWQLKKANMYETGNVFKGTMQKFSDEATNILIEIDDMDYKHAIWKYHNDTDVTLTFIKPNENGLNNDDMIKNKIYYKVLPLCINCKCDMLFLYKNTFPNHIKCENIKCCDNFEKYDYMKYSTLKAMNYVIFHENICKNEFYFYCGQCNNYSICGGCSLIKHEIEMNKKNKIIKTNRKKRKHSDMDQDDDRFIKLIKENKLLQNDLIMEKQMVQKLKNMINDIQTDRDHWRQKHDALYENIQSIFNSMDSNI